MNVLTIGGATQDVLLHYDGADIMTISQQQGTQSYLLFEAGEKIEVDGIELLTGGGATNVAVSFKRQGFNTACICIVGSDEAGNYIIQDLQREGVDTQYVKQITTTATGTSYIVTSRHSDRTIFTYRGANTHLTFTDINEEAVHNASYIYITSLSGNAAEMLPELTTLAKKHRIPIAINPGKSQLASNTKTLKESLKNMDILIVNSSEARILMSTLSRHDNLFKTAFLNTKSQNPCILNQADDTPYLLNQSIACQGDFFSITNFFNTTLTMGPRIVVVTNGANGVYVGSQNMMYFHPSIRIPVINTVGAGDAFGSCFVGSIINGLSIEEALTRGIANSASVLSHQGAKAGLLTATMLKDKTASIVNKLQTFSL
ncbi:carbohydrate kinase family protein [Candidatus Dependentiae bacterium]|nr:carbohydrate kinase family protein [Candidatus Dependentiae bacterium]